MTHLDAANHRTTRRDFLRRATMTTGAALTMSSMLSSSGRCQTARPPSHSFIGSGDVVLFQGDSITDAGRDRGREDDANSAAAMGRGYAFLAGSALLVERCDARLKIYNRGISGNKVFQLAGRWDKDCLALKPNVVSILIGVNDIWHKLNGRYDGTVEIYERDCGALLERTRRNLPDVKLVICEPFVLRCGAVNESWFPEFDGYRTAAKRVATTFEAVWVPFQSEFDEAIQKAPPEYWAADGVHPTMAGAHLMARAWLEAVSGA